MRGLCKAFIHRVAAMPLHQVSHTFPHPSSSKGLLLRSKISSYPDVAAYTSNPALGKEGSEWPQYEKPSLRKTKNQTQNKITTTTKQAMVRYSGRQAGRSLSSRSVWSTRKSQVSLGFIVSPVYVQNKLLYFFRFMLLGKNK